MSISIMKIKSGYVIRKIAGQTMAIPVGSRVKDLHGMIALNETGAFLWERLCKEQTIESLVQALVENYEVTKEQAEISVNNYIHMLVRENLLEQEE